MSPVRAAPLFLLPVLILTCMSLHPSGHVNSSPGWHALKDIATWRYPTLEGLLHARNVEPLRGRIWDRHLLRSSGSVLNLGQMRGLAETLERGERIGVTAIGSSMVASYAGCWGSPAAVQEVVQTLHYTYNKGKEWTWGMRHTLVVEPLSGPWSPYMHHSLCDQNTEIGVCSGQGDHGHLGWMHGFMSLVNETWPHKDHLLVNVGSGGHPFQSYASQSECASAVGASRSLV